MYKFSQISQERLALAHRELITLCKTVIKIVDFAVLETYRDEATQNKAFESGRSKLKFPLSKHNKNPAMAIDIAPYPVNWKDIHSFYYLAGIVLGTAAQLKEIGKMTHSIRWGGDWNTNNIFIDETFSDLVHFELCLD